ncbi:helix-turn-helix domain-containing protein [Azospirillum brasilense]|uniref:helix-turn-helix domain-containing protein n=1 Tax=Azospirillum argentinense TaxID=2970906 RepID=UPI00190C2887|nr:helix-turn-helix transcriptional regulator [Azospirillum argentinense]MBK3797848.1 helix-turn-helix domain-containing protein [Azospirillum argentinense]
MHYVTLSPEQCRAARGLRGLTIEQLAEATKLTRKTLSDFENGKTTPQPRTLRDIVTALEQLGVEFIAEGELSPDGGAGVRLRKEKPQTA